MKTTTFSYAIAIGVAMLVGSLATVRAQQPASVLVGVYTDAQATRGEKVYTEFCKICHGSKMEGDLGPPVAGKDFVAAWKDTNVGELLDKIVTSMPSNAPGTLTPQQCADVLAYMLSVNKYPAGQTELGTDASPLKAIKMAAPPNP